MSNKCVCKRCGIEWKIINNPEYIATDMHIWVEDK